MEAYNWSDYYKARGIKVRDELKDALVYVTTGLNALDLGSGAFRETLYMLERGFSVVAVDPEIGLGLLANEIHSDNFVFECVPIQNFSFPHDYFDFVSANYSLQFVPKRKLQKVFDGIHTSMKPGGIFSFQLFGKKDGRNKWWQRSWNFYSEDEILNIIGKFELIDITETESLQATAKGEDNYCHIYRVIVRR